MQNLHCLPNLLWKYAIHIAEFYLLQKVKSKISALTFLRLNKTAKAIWNTFKTLGYNHFYIFLSETKNTHHKGALKHGQSLNRNWYELSVAKQLFGGKIRKTLEPLAIPNEVLRAHLDALRARSLSLLSLFIDLFGNKKSSFCIQISLQQNISNRYGIHAVFLTVVWFWILSLMNVWNLETRTYSKAKAWWLVELKEICS